MDCFLIFKPELAFTGWERGSGPDMYLYAMAAVAAIIISALFLDRRMKAEGTSHRPLLVFCTGASIVICLAFPFVFSFVDNLKAIIPDKGHNFSIFLITLLICAMLALVLAYAASLVLAGREQKEKVEGQADAPTEAVISEFPQHSEKFVDSTQNVDKMGVENIDGKTEKMADFEAKGKPFLEKADWDLQDIQTAMQEQTPPDDVLEEVAAAAEPEGELPQESAGDTQEEPDPLPAEFDLLGWIDGAFSLKYEGKLQQALEYFMKALACNPEEDLVFQLIVEICVLYKDLGQVDFGRDMLEAFSIQFGHVMKPALKAEIERNLV